MCKPKEKLQKIKEEVFKVHEPMELDREFQQSQPLEQQTAVLAAEPQFAQPEQVQEAAPAPEMEEQPVQQQELTWKERQMQRWERYQARKQGAENLRGFVQRHEEEVETRRRMDAQQARLEAQQQRKRKERQAVADRQLERASNYLRENEGSGYYRRESEFVQQSGVGQGYRFKNMEQTAALLLKEKDARNFLKQMRGVEKLWQYLQTEETELRFRENGVVPLLRRQTTVTPDMLDRLAERREKLNAELADCREQCARLESWLRELVPEEKQRQIPELGDPEQAAAYDRALENAQNTYYARTHQELSAEKVRELYADEVIRSQRPVTLRNLEQSRAAHLEEKILPHEFAFIENRRLRDQSDLIAAREEVKESYARDLDRDRQKHFDQMLEKLDQLPDQESQRALLEQELRAIGYVGLDDKMTGLFNRIWDGKAVILHGGSDNVWHTAMFALRTALVDADKRYRQLHPELNQVPAMFTQVPDQDAWKAADMMVADYVREAMENASYQIRVPNCAILGAILDSGRFKTQMETNTSGGDLCAENRIKFTSETFGVQSGDLKLEDYEIYGYASHGDLVRESTLESRVGSRVSQYGQVVVKLKTDRMRDRTTMTVGDSLDAFVRSRPNWADQPDLQAVTYKKRYEMLVAAYKHQNRMRNGVDDPVDLERMLNDLQLSYTELQFHGGVRLEDIESVTLLADMQAPEGPVKALEQEIPPELVARLKEIGIQAKIVKGGEEHEL